MVLARAAREYICLEQIHYCNMTNAVQTAILDTFARMRIDGLRRQPEHKLQKALLPAELCFLSHMRKFGQAANYCKSKGILPTCWRLDGAFSECYRRMMNRDDLYERYRSRYSAVSAGSVNGSHLAFVARRQPRMLFVGDSVSAAWAKASECELHRAGLDPSRDVELHRFEIRGEFATNTSLVLERLRSKLGRLADAGGAIVFASFPCLHVKGASRRRAAIYGVRAGVR